MLFQPDANIFLQAYAPGLETFMLFISLIDSTEFFLVAIPLILWCYDKTLGSRLLLIFSVSSVINPILKIFFHTPRPYWISESVQAFTSEISFGMPSGAAQLTFAFFGYIGAWFRKRLVWALCIALIILVGISRIYIGVHFLGDVLTGWLFALVLLLVFLRYERPASTWFFQKSVSFRILLAVGISCAFILLGQAVISGLGPWEVPAAWSDLAYAQTDSAINPLSPGTILSGAGLLFGAIAGAGISAEYIPYGIEGSICRKAIRFLTGILSLPFSGLPLQILPNHRILSARS